MDVHAERGMSAPPEVVFNTAIDPNRIWAWLPVPLRRDDIRRPELDCDALLVRWSGGSEFGWSARLQVRALDAGGATVRLELVADAVKSTDVDDQRLAEIADRSLADLADEVAENFTTG